MNANDRADDIKAKLNDAENAAAALPGTSLANAVRSKLTALHATLKAGLDEQASTLGISQTHVDSINAGGGTNKD